MYRYSEFDTAFLAERNAQFRAQVERRTPKLTYLYLRKPK